MPRRVDPGSSGLLHPYIKSHVDTMVSGNSGTVVQGGAVKKLQGNNLDAGFQFSAGVESESDSLRIRLSRAQSTICGKLFHQELKGLFHGQGAASAHSSNDTPLKWSLDGGMQISRMQEQDPEDPTGGGGPEPNPGSQPQGGTAPGKTVSGNCLYNLPGIDCQIYRHYCRKRYGLYIFPIISDLHFRAYTYAKTALRTLDAISLASPSMRKALWDWGKDPAWEHLWSYTNNGFKTTNLHAQYSGLAHWFGPFSSGRLDQVRNIFRIVVKRFEKGILGKPIRYTCNPALCYSGNLAKHLIAEQIILCEDLLDGFVDQVEWYMEKSVTILHEHFHTAVDNTHPRDESEGGVCEGGWKYPYVQCYREHLYDNPDLWTSIGTNDSIENPRKLIVHKRYGTAANNVDNFVGFALRRMIDPQFGFCSLPRNPEEALTSTGKPSK